MSILATVQRLRAEQQRIRRDAAIGADLIPRPSPDDDRYAGLDLAARGRDLEALGIARSRLRMAPGDLPAELRQTAERIATELQVAGPDDIGRWATDCQYAYADVPNIAEPVQVAMFHAWALAIDGLARDRSPPVHTQAHNAEQPIA